MIIPTISLVPELIHKKIARGLIRTYAREHNWHEIDLTTGNLGYGWIHYAMIRTLRPERVLCIGSRYGYIPIICALACKDNGRGFVDFVDAGFDENDPSEPDNWGGVGTWKKINPKKYFGKFGAGHHIKLHVTTTKEFAAAHKSDRWGYIYVDGDHSYKGAKFDFTTFWPRLLPDGAMSFHDIHVKRINDLVLGVHKLWAEIKHTHPNNTLELPGNIGLGILTKRKKKALFIDI